MSDSKLVLSFTILAERRVLHHGLINYKVTKIKYRLYWCSIEFIDWRYFQSCWYFRPSFVKCCPSTLLSGLLPPPPPKVKVHYIQTVCGWEGVGGVLSCVGDNILQEFKPLYLNRFNTYNTALLPQTKT
jgi:hypothetical protein